jgi:hypothetical protein
MMLCKPRKRNLSTSNKHANTYVAKIQDAAYMQVDANLQLDANMQGDAKTQVEPALQVDASIYKSTGK